MTEGEAMSIAVEVTLAIFVLGLAYHCGRLAARVDAVERWRDEVSKDVKTILQTVSRLDARQERIVT